MMNAERFRQLLDSYGGASNRWPADLRGEMHAFLDAHPEARPWLQDALVVDRLLDGYAPETGDLSQRILAALPRSALDRLVDWLLPSVPAQWWRPALAGAMPLLLGMAIGLNPMMAATDESVDWTIQEQALLMAPEGDWYE